VITKQPETQPPPSSLEPPKPVRWLPVGLLTFVLIVLNTGWIANSEMRTGVTEITIATLFIGVTFVLFLLTLINQAVRRIWGAQTAFNQAELMLIYSLLSICNVVAGVGHMGFFTPFLTNVFWFANQTNGWKTFWNLLPPYIGPRDPQVLSGFYNGHSTFFQPFIMRAWAGPLLVWSVFFLVLLWMTMCMATIVRRRWAEEEHLPFPIIALPLEMTREDTPIYRNRLLWVGFALPCISHSLNSLASIFPGVPAYPINSAKDLMAGLSFPWNGLTPLFGGIHPAGVGLGYLINTDVLFSLWFFYFVRKAFNMWGVVENWRDVGQGQFGDGAHQFPYTPYMAWGAWLALAIAVLWQGRSYFGGYFQRAWKGDPTGVERDEPMSARVAVFGFVVSFLALCAFVWSSGGSWWLPVVFLAMYVLIMAALSRLQAETAVLSPYLVWVDPQSILTGAGGTTGLSRMDAVHTGMLSWFNSDYRAASLPHQLQAFVGQKRAGGSMRGLPLALMIAAAVSLVCALLWDLQMYYVNGASTGHVNQWRISMGSMPWNNVQKYLQHPIAPNSQAVYGMLAGIAITAALSFLRGSFAGFPLSPAAYVLNMSWANDLFWLDMLLAWIFKSAILRYGGMKMYRQALPLFLGLILGDFVTGSIWSIVGTVLHLSLFRTFST